MPPSYPVGAKPVVRPRVSSGLLSLWLGGGLLLLVSAQAAAGSNVTVTVTPNRVIIGAGQTQLFQAAVTGTSNQAVTWSVTAGTIDNGGEFVAPSVTSWIQVTVTATSKADPTAQGTASAGVTVALAITTTSLPRTTINQPYTLMVNFTGGYGRVSWAISAGSLPPGLTLGKGGKISGTPTQTGAFSFTVQVTDSSTPTPQVSAQALVADVMQKPQAVRASFFAMTVSSQSDPWPTSMGVEFASWRSVSGKVEWYQINTAEGVYYWSQLDTWLARAKANGQSVMYTIFQTPQWASSNPTANCNNGVTGACAPPNDLNPDGTGTNQHFKDFVTALMNHVGPGAIKFLEIWNEPNIPIEWTGSNAQLIRMAQDAGTLAKAIDPNVRISSPAETGDGSGDMLAMAWLDGFLAAGGGPYVDVIGFHGYVWTAEDVATRIENLRIVTTTYGQQNKPVFDTEGSWGVFDPISDPDLQAAFAARHYLVQAAEAINRFYWYGWDFTNTGAFYVASSNSLNSAGAGYQQFYQWIVGATPTGPCAATGTIWTCYFTRASGYQAVAMWDTSQTCSNGVCTYSTQTAAAQYVQYRDLAGNLTTITGNQVQVGLKPILLENKSAW